MNALLQSFPQSSIFWLVVSGLIGAVIGAVVKFVFDNVLGPRYQQSREARSSLRKYTYPLLRAADALDARLYNFIRQSEPSWLTDEYYRLTTLYVIGCYFGWCRLLDAEAFLDYELSDRRVKRFNVLFSRVFKSLSSFYYFEDLKDMSQAAKEDATVPRLALTAIGELMSGLGNSGSTRSDDVLALVDFSNKLRTSKDFQEWFAYVEKLLKNVKREASDMQWNRLLVFATHLRVFLAFLDTNNRYTAAHQIPYLHFMDHRVAKRAREEVVAAGYKALIHTEHAPATLGQWPGDPEPRHSRAR
jgi:hypothetical protein